MLSSKETPEPPKALTEVALRQFIKKALDKGWIRDEGHSAEKGAERNISNEDVIHGLERKDWKLTENRYHPKLGYSYTILTTDIEGEELEIAVSPKKDQTLKIVTKY